MLKDPCLDIPYCPRARDLLGGIGVYDLEETLGEELWKLNPNDTEDRTHVIKKYILNPPKNHTYRHQHALLKELERTINNKDFDFSSLFDNDDDDDYTSCAWGSDEIYNPRRFFEDIHRIACDVWKEDIEEAESENQID